MPVWNFHAADDGSVSVGLSDSAVSSLHGAGANIIYTPYQTGGHPIWATAYSTPPFMGWLMAQRRGVASANEPLLSITSPASEAVYWTGATSLSLLRRSLGPAGERGRGKWPAALVAEKKLKPPATHAAQTFRCAGQPIYILARIEPRSVNANPITGQGLTRKTLSEENAHDACAR